MQDSEAEPDKFRAAGICASENDAYALYLPSI
jgi:hypothetical protein